MTELVDSAHELLNVEYLGSQVIDAITQTLGLGSYLSWDETKRCEWLTTELMNSRPLIRKANLRASADVLEVLDTFCTIAEIGDEPFGAYIISMTRAPSDVLAVHLLQKEMGCVRHLRVAPLFETKDDLIAAPASMKALFENIWYKQHFGLVGPAVRCPLLCRQLVPPEASSTRAAKYRNLAMNLPHFGSAA